MTGRWLSRDFIEDGNDNLYLFCQNVIFDFDIAGLTNEIGDFGWDNYSVEITQCCNGKKFFPSSSCCRDGEIFSWNLRNTGVSVFCLHERFWYQTIVRVRPFSWQQLMLTHCWLNVDGVRFGAYPNGGPFKEYQNNNRSVQDDSRCAKFESQFNTSRTDIYLSECQYDIEKFKRCLLSYLTGERQWVWTVWSNCGDFVEYAVEHCKEWSKR